MMWKKHTKEQLIKNTQGAISLFLALLVVPFYSVAAILMEAGRYQNAYRGLDSAISASELSVLAQKDSYLFDRFGLLAIDQETNISSEFWSYLNKQDTIDTRSFELSKLQSSVEGVYPLADINVLRQQIEEFSKTVVPTKMVMSIGDLDNLVSQIESHNTLFKDTLTMLDKLETSVEKGLKSYEAQEKAKEKMEDAVKNKKEYDEKYETLENALNALNNHLKTDRPADENEAAQWDKTLEELKNTAVDARDDYKKATSTTNSSISDVAKKIDDAVQAETSAHDSLMDSITSYNGIRVEDDINEALKEKKEEVDKALKADGISDSQKEDLLKQKKEIEDAMSKNSNTEQLGKDLFNSQQKSEDTKDTLKKYNSEECTDAITGLTGELKELEKLDFENMSSDNIEDVLGNLHTTDLGKFSDVDEFNALWEKTKKEVEKMNLDLGDMFDALIELLNIDVAYDPELNSIIDVDYYNQNFGGLPSQKDRSQEANSLQSVYEEDDMQTAKENLEKMGLPVLESEKGHDTSGNPTAGSSQSSTSSSGNILKKGLALVKSIKKTVGEAFSLLGQMATIGGNMKEGLLLKGYMAYTLPNRVNYSSGSSLAGKSYTSGGGLMEPDDERSLVNNMKDSLTGVVNSLPRMDLDISGRKGYSFCGAELEYVMFGSMEEKENQQAAYKRLVLLNLVLCVIQTYTNDFVQLVTTSAAAGLSVLPPLSAAVKLMLPLAFAYANAAIDTIKLCNGGKVALIKRSSDLNITPTGLTKAITELTNLQMSNKNKIKQSLEKLQNGTDKLLSSKNNKDGSSNSNSTSPSQATPSTPTTSNTTGKEDEPLIDGSKYLNSLNKFDYSEYMMILLLLFWNNEDELLNRFVDIIQMEQTNRFNTVDNTQYSLADQISGKRKKFDVDTAYTMIRVQAKGKFVNVLPVPSLSRSSAWRVDRLLYRGY